ncbi:hypothetical protein BW716_06570 [[Flexibacter] sp. ATCC 35208]|nr:hypothetical protein BW716_06570 [[Flexibacter] sp. ATCC 35208]
MAAQKKINSIQNHSFRFTPLNKQREYDSFVVSNQKVVTTNGIIVKDGQGIISFAGELIIYELK